MNILQMKYAVEVAKCGSLSRAAENLFVAQPNVSRSIKELEADLGISIFTRSAKGMELTAEGADFIARARDILREIDMTERMYRGGREAKSRFSVSVPRACYISDGFAEFSKTVGDGPCELFYKETNSQRAITNIIDNGYNLGIIRYAEDHDKLFKAMLDEKGLEYEMICEFRYMLVMNKDSALASLPEIHFADLIPYIEIAHADPFVPSLPMSRVFKEELPDNIERRIFVFERASQFDLLAENPETFMWVSPPSPRLLERYGLVLRECPDNNRSYKDVLIYKKGYRLSRLDRAFLTAVCEAKRRYINEP